MQPTPAHCIEAATEALFVRGEMAAVEAYFSPDYIVHLTGEDKVPGHAGLRSVLSLYQRAFSGLRVEVVILAQEGERVSWQRTFRGVHQAAFKGFPGSGRELVWRDVGTSVIRAGVIVEEWVLTDLAERLLLARKA